MSDSRDELAARREFKERIGVGERQPTHSQLAAHGTTKTTVVPDETKRRTAGYQHYAWDGRVSATVRPEAVKLKMKLSPE